MDAPLGRDAGIEQLRYQQHPSLRARISYQGMGTGLSLCCHRASDSAVSRDLVTPGCILPVLLLQDAARGAGTSWGWSTAALPMPVTLRGQLLASVEERIRRCKP